MIAGFFAVATVFNMNMLNDNGAGDVSLEDVAVMAQAHNSENQYICFYCGGDGSWGGSDCTYCLNGEINDIINAKGFKSIPGAPCFEYVTSSSVGGSTTVYHGESNTTTVGFSFSGPETSTSVTNSSGESTTYTYNTAASQVLLGYAINCEPISTSGTCKSRSCDDVRMSY
jgi:hypothetical protein